MKRKARDFGIGRGFDGGIGREGGSRFLEKLVTRSERNEKELVWYSGESADILNSMLPKLYLCFYGCDFIFYDITKDW